MTYVFGPVPSRRLGLSLGIDLIPFKTCTYDCLYCQLGRTTNLTAGPKRFAPTVEVIEELRNAVKRTHPDTITLAGSGEPTLHSEIDQVIDSAKGITETPVALLTNGALLWQKEVRNRVLSADMIMPTLTTVFEETYQKIHRPCAGFKLSLVIKGLKELREVYHGVVLLEVVLLAGINDGYEELQGIKKAIEEIHPDRIQLNTVVRPPADPRALCLDMGQLEKIKGFFGEKAEIIAGISSGKQTGEYDSHSKTIVEMAKRRPITSADIALLFDMSPDESECILKGLLLKGAIRKQRHEKGVFYTANDKIKNESGGEQGSL